MAFWQNTADNTWTNADDQWVNPIIRLYADKTLTPAASALDVNATIQRSVSLVPAASAQEVNATISRAATLSPQANKAVGLSVSVSRQKSLQPIAQGSIDLSVSLTRSKVLGPQLSAAQRVVLPRSVNLYPAAGKKRLSLTVSLLRDKTLLPVAKSYLWPVWGSFTTPQVASPPAADTVLYPDCFLTVKYPDQRLTVAGTRVRVRG